ncbi:15-hydroxyprostaglandin dehydrogenase [Fusarium denticulatum]|uniref:15-hydroxyprostaglandin dehydrogenase n=1 Tax=Fusarium denticulatum TaxID=48507 RepID=A0A8H5SY83_9HYPO|nr:15-hydroxyprostaglandin dehydrogenase [Fusarium denticulatum]
MDSLTGISEDFSNKVVIVTGGSSGIGYAIANQFSRRNATVIIADVSKPGHLPDKATFIKTDVTNWASQLELFQKAVELYKRIDVVCANAGISEDKEAFQDKVDEHGVPLEPRWNTLQVNLVGVCISTKLAIHFLKQHGGGKIILTTSLSGYDASGLPTYAASKHGVVGLMRGLRDHLPPLGITINCLAPGFTETNLLPSEETVQSLKDAGINVQSADTVALAALYYASKDGVNGEAFAIINGKYFEMEVGLNQAFRGILGGATSNSERKRQGGRAHEVVDKLFRVDL